jgi:hypothetical protein
VYPLHTPGVVAPASALAAPAVSSGLVMAAPLSGRQRGPTVCAAAPAALASATYESVFPCPTGLSASSHSGGGLAAAAPPPLELSLSGGWLVTAGLEACCAAPSQTLLIPMP